MTSVLYSSGLNFQNGNPLGGEVRRLRNDLTEALRKIDQQDSDLSFLKQKYNDLVGKLADLHGDKTDDGRANFDPMNFFVNEAATQQTPVPVAAPVQQAPVPVQLTPQQQFLMQRQQNTVVSGGRR